MSQLTNTASVDLLEGSGPVAPAAILGTNLEIVTETHTALLSDRLDNPKFCGPADPRTGLADGWLMRGNHQAMHCELIEGMSLSGNASQLVHNYVGAHNTILQTGRVVKQDEHYEVELWAKVRHHPVPIEIALGPLAVRQPEYSRAAVVIDASYWKRYTVRLHSPCEDNTAVFSITLTGAGVLLLDQIHLRPVGAPIVHPDVQASIRSLQLTGLRFPGGCASTNYRWKLGTGPVHLRPSLPDPINRKRAEYDFGTDEYLAMCHEQSIQPFITINIGSGTPQEAGEWAAYCAEWFGERNLPLPEIYFHMGNEQYGSWESSHMDASMYVEALRVYVPAVRSGYPRARIVALGEPFCSGVAGYPASPLRQTVLEEAKALFDVLSINRYKGQWYAEPADQMCNVVDSVAKIARDLTELVEDIRRSGSNAGVALTEWNYWMQASHWDGGRFAEPDDVQHGLFYSGMIHALARLAPAMEVANFYHLLNVMGMIRNDGGSLSETSMADLYRLYRPAFPGEVVPIELRSPEMGEGIASVDAIALRTDDSLWLYAANRSPEAESVVSFGGFPEIPDEALMMTAADYKSPLRHAEAPTVRGHVTLPPLTIIRLRYSLLSGTG
ncbi:hypothetical protein [Paenibacillus contaminans]|uniref:Alpha-L-arabinofuranosidase 1 catalytic domain-containing protein n=1 Tax=Paenibacillus contaminans TaxID=450362 RepID=A0A329MCP9_9BACL|nr:hypothetical protein [Paenibacillus contaminans]RAV17835.1 hypothetical protein DQG23_25830 [Paenibacillus contaminans]